jgi:aspartate/glutamate/glutamine transport system substrate-binding protein
VELTRALAKRILGDESKVELRLLPRPSRLPMLLAGAVDVVVSMIPMTADSARQCDFSHPYFSSGVSLLVRGGIKLEDLAGKSIAFRQQSHNQYGAELQRIAVERNVKVTVRYYPTIEAAADAMVKGEVAAVGGNFVDLDTYRKQRTGFAVDTTLLEERQVGVAVKKGDADLLAAVNQVIDELRTSGQLKRMTEKWRLPYLLSE